MIKIKHIIFIDFVHLSDFFLFNLLYIEYGIMKPETLNMTRMSFEYFPTKF